MNTKITPAYIKMMYETNHPEGKFFTRNNMKFSGDTMSNYAVSSEPVMVDTWSQGLVECYQLRRKRPVKHGLMKPAYFAVNDFSLIHSKD